MDTFAPHVLLGFTRDASRIDFSPVRFSIVLYEAGKLLLAQGAGRSTASSQDASSLKDPRLGGSATLDLEGTRATQRNIGRRSSGGHPIDQVRQNPTK